MYIILERRRAEFNGIQTLLNQAFTNNLATRARAGRTRSITCSRTTSRAVASIAVLTRYLFSWAARGVLVGQRVANTAGH